MTIYSEHALAYLAAGWEIRPEKRKQCPASGQQNASGCCVLAEARLSAAKTLAELLSLSDFSVFADSIVASESGEKKGVEMVCYRCDCCAELTCVSESEWDNADIILELGPPSGLLAVHVTLEGIEWWLEQIELSEDYHSATVHGAEEWYALFQCDREHYNLSGILAPGVRVISEGERVKLAPSLDASGAYCAWVHLPIRLEHVPAWIVERLTLPEVA